MGAKMVFSFNPLESGLCFGLSLNSPDLPDLLVSIPSNRVYVSDFSVILVVLSPELSFNPLESGLCFGPISHI